MSAVVMRKPPARRAGRGLPRRVRQARPSPRAARRRKRRWPVVLFAAAIALAWAFWPATPQVDAPPVTPSTPPKTAVAPTKTAPKTKPASALPSQRLKAPDTVALQRARRELLLAAIRARAASLRPCVPGDAAAVDVPVRLHVTRAGAVKALEFTGASPPRVIADCLRGVAGTWNFQDVELPSDVELFATLALGPGV